MNKHCNEYVLLFGAQRYHPDLHIMAAKYRFDFLKNARKIAAKVGGAYFFNVHYVNDFSDVMYIQEI